VSVVDEADAVALVLRSVRESMAGQGAVIEAVGHRVVHGGADLPRSVRLDARAKDAIRRLGELAPLHNPPALRVIEAADAALPGVPQVAAFDTSFFATLPEKAYVYPLPYRWFQDWGLRRFGFHGLSHAYCTRRAGAFLGGDEHARRIVSCHLGGGSSATAVLDGKAVATTMGFSPLEGLMMGTRCGSVDPELLLHVQRAHGVTVEELDRVLHRESGLLGVSGLSPDLARIEESAAQGNGRAQLAFDMFADRVRSAIGSLAATLGGIDVLLFTDRIGESSPRLRATACEGLEFMGVAVDPDRNERAEADCEISGASSRARVLVLRTREELAVACEVATVLGAAGARAVGVQGGGGSPNPTARSSREES
jgi:acetate kinase